jgi:hypothetical protein
MDCRYCDGYGFCLKYSNLEVDVPCPGNADCDDYVEEDKDVE